MQRLILHWLKGRPRVTLAEIRREMGKPAMDLFMVHHKDWKYSFCMECNSYVRERIFDKLNDMCLECKEDISNWNEDEEGSGFGFVENSKEGGFFDGGFGSDNEQYF